MKTSTQWFGIGSLSRSLVPCPQCMRTTFLVSVASFGLSVAIPLRLAAQGTTTFISYLDLPSRGTLPIASNAWLAEGFRTGTNALGYRLDKIEVAMGGAEGSPNGFRLAIYSESWRVPQSLLWTLSGPSSPIEAGTYAYFGPDIVLPPRTAFFIVASSSQPVSVGSYQWSFYGLPLVYRGEDNWGPFTSVQSLNGGVWVNMTGTIGGFRYAIYGTAIPEPSAWLVFGLGGGLLFWSLRRRADQRFSSTPAS